ncbi:MULTISPECIES: outer membrane lipid asymmetry maintenance protein MlaD [Idiomarina]|jgi:phospholipid/cholesterol/gamma-HCH transport system substrate-binding protein|uniref:Outer membrane lipid asymmetry maintenance protein MlaD n=1 Tax=Idiomarina abyssalis TaxID=86102 RepID=A0A8I1G9T6_9GAMM|nr:MULTISPECIES: outer membrane lipid asymmetry maintenance protein MlaD [Idiomarina]MAB21850.1 outer membrane lipid asymmetry maintenance protein MlaD [Idiomarina sp.]MAO68679.1 outer membrane lipid asymmetry maintenance protein MlaD [Idiomarina sp.]MBE91423.1 outer membrane lipid asymmetry maintenance protein MlaD [Idiomarina sp.]MBF81170.1 outer membrane lipid asymmetry maintenance protein MlaD [Idiomarina sp.]MBH94248.1 outer membrane lipid asymmetry maintenance protein MlaD [Idiomarina sp|tara:strand:- start:314 stop:781 length:468 start_codon:yes stop_codon:yes gene_type:complete
MESRKTQLWVGVFVVVGILALFFIALRAASGTMTTSGDTYTLYAKFDNVGSLKVRSPVKVGGVVVGRVTDISLSGDYYEPRVEMTISKEYDQFSETSTLSVLTSGLLGEQYLGLEPGFIDDSVDMLEDGDMITDTKSALVLENLIGQFLFSQGND